MQAGQPTVSVVIPTFNRAAVLARAIDSVLRQSFQDFEIIIVDDGSTDSTHALVQRYLDRERTSLQDRVRYVKQNRCGVARARNRGIQLARGKYVAFLDSDDEWLEDKLRRQVEYLDASEVALVHTARTLRTLPGNKRARILPYPQKLASNREQFLRGDTNIAMTVMVRKSVLNVVGVFDESLVTTQDLDLWLRIARHYELGLVEENLVNSYKMADSNMAANAEQTYRDRIRVIEKMSEDDHGLVDNRGWYHLLARHCFRYSIEKIRRSRYLAGVYWLGRAGAAYGRFSAASIKPPEKGKPVLNHVLE